MQSTLTDSSETDRQVVLIHVNNILLAMRTSNRLHRRKGGYDSETEGKEYAAMHSLVELQQHLFAGAVPVPGPTSSVSPVRQHNDCLTASSLNACVGGAASNSVNRPASSPFPNSQMLPLGSSAAHYEVSELAILSAFANVCRSPSTSTVVTGVALAALVDMLDLPCSFISTYGIHTAIEAASDTCAEVHDNGSHEVLLSRIFNVYVAALNHPAAAMAEGEVYVRAIGRMMVLATLPEATQLLKRTVEKNMRSIVMTLFRRLLYPRNDPAEQEAVVMASTVVLQCISRLISGEVASFDTDGNEVATSTVARPESLRSVTGASSSDWRESETERSVALVQLEGLVLAQDCLLLLRCSLHRPECAPLLDAVQNQLCRSLLIAGLGTSRSVMLVQVLRTVHLVMHSASEYLIPQIYNFIRVLHLNPLEVLTSELSDAGVGDPGGSPSGTSSPLGKVSPASPASAASGIAFTRLSQMQLQQKQERRNILLDSLAEFCSDPRFGSFCFINYDLSWRYSSLLPHLCQVLVNHAYPMSREDEALDRWGRGSGAGGDGADGGGSGGGGDGCSGGFPRNKAVRSPGCGANGSGGAGGGRTSTGVLLQCMQLTALVAATNMVSGVALRAIDAGASLAAEQSPSSFNELCHLTQHVMKEKETLNQFAALFEESPVKKGIPFLLQSAVLVPRGTEAQASMKHRTQLVVAEPAGGREIGEALYRLSIILNKRVLGDYIGDQGRDKAETGSVSAGEDGGAAPPFSVRFFAEQLNGFIRQFCFHQKPLLTAIREMVYLLCLPGESQKIDRVMESFAKHWYEQNLARLPNGEVLKDENINPFHSESGAFVLSFAIIMLNTDQHSGKVAHQMKKDDFIKMNRGIDDGKDVPAEYLGRVYDDVRQHEVVMADMMDRGFANDTTWRLEMRPCTSFLQIALSDGSATVQESAAAVESLASLSAREPIGAPVSELNAVVRTFDQFLFQSLWKRSLLMFDGMLESSVDEVSQATVAREKSLAEAVADVQRHMPVEMSVLQSSLRGVSMLARAAHSFGFPAIADQCLLGLLQHVAMNLSNADEAVRHLYRSVPKMLCLTEVFALLADIHSSLKDSWVPLARLILDMQLMGLFVDHSEAAALQGRKSHDRPGNEIGEALANDSDGCQANKDGKAGSSGFVAILLQDPGICANVFAPLTSAAAGKKRRGDRGWFSSLFGSDETPHISEAELSELQAAQQRIRSCIPDMRRMLSLLRVVAADPEHGSRCVMSLCAACSIGTAPVVNRSDAHGKDQNVHTHDRVRADRISEAAAYAASYELALICAVVGGASTPDVLQPEHLAPLTARISCLLAEVGAFLSDTRAGDNVRHYWFSVGSRVVEAALQLMAAHWRGHAGAMALVQLWTCWMRAPAVVFTAVVAQQVASFLYHAVVVDGAQAEAVGKGEAVALRSKQWHMEQDVPWSSGSEVLVLLAPFATHAAAVSDVTVHRQITSILLFVVRQGDYSVVEDTESIVSLCLSFSIWAREASDGSTRGRRGKSGPATAATGFPSGASVSEILGLCGRNVLIQHAGNGLEEKRGNGGPDGTVSNADSWYSQWLFVLRSLGAVALCSPESRDSSEALLCLQRALLDSEARNLPASAVVAVYRDILIPLTERLCVPKAKVQTGLRWSSTVASSKGDDAGSASGEGSGGNDDCSKRGMVGSLFTALLAPPSNSNAEDAAVDTMTTSGTGSASPAHLSSAQTLLVSTEVKCRLLSLVPKVLLRYTAVLTYNQDALVSLWRQILGTLYAVYSAYPPNSYSADGVQDEAMLVQEAVEETVKNMVYVMAATWKDSEVALQFTEQTSALWAVIGHLVQPFPFSGQLIEFMASEKLFRSSPRELALPTVTS
ncbi:hypothetical protein ABL78_0425 [Leptomonas seymouri]|uniref:SEC7 domain-containing protein n=1 Tax=Leptomonas seymouri TaxID=5684 RepID=A0A0N1IMJ5_LEPSE|nr:hypothetical protein ABL78_0425 [Leptomonas seymouri]|eukprot:KPI90495.1 hypothetical protein ABL78_0425 [Leptomonas seymouri]